MADSETSFLTCRRCGRSFPSWEAAEFWVDDIRLPKCPSCGSGKLTSGTPARSPVWIIVLWCCDIANAMVGFGTKSLPGIISLCQCVESRRGREVEVNAVLDPMLKEARECADMLRRTYSALDVQSGPCASRSQAVDRSVTAAKSFILDSTSILQSILSVSTFLDQDGNEKWDMVRCLHGSLNRVFSMIPRYRDCLEEALHAPQVSPQVTGFRDEEILTMFSTWPDCSQGRLTI